MAQVQGHTCDRCEKFAKLPTDTSPETLPDGWVKVILPGTTRDREQDKVRAFCSALCHAEFAMARVDAETTIVRAA